MRKIDYYLHIILLFYIFCFAGWVWESCFVSIQDKKITNRGFLTGPYIPIYGFGGIIIFFVFQRFNSPIFSINTIYIYVLGMIFTTILEYITSWLMELILKARWWDYSNDFCNLNGRICLVSSLFWGFLSVLFVQIINPILLSKLELLNHDLSLILVTAITTTILIDLGVTIVAIINLQQRIIAIVNFERSIRQNFKEKIEDIAEPYKKLLADYKTKVYNITNPFTKRLMSAYPKLKFLSNERQSAFDKLQEIKKKIKRRK